MTKRSYRQNCALAQAGDLIGERWTMLLIRDLLVSPRRFGELQGSLKGIGANLLAARLKELEAEAIIARRRDAGARPIYELTERGRALEPALLALVRWGLVHSGRSDNDYHHQDDWDLLALKALFQPDRAGDLRMATQFRSDDLTGWMQIADGDVSIGLGEVENADIVIAGTIKDLFTGSQLPQDLLHAGAPSSLDQFMSAFALRA